MTDRHANGHKEGKWFDRGYKEQAAGWANESSGWVKEAVKRCMKAAEEWAEAVLVGTVAEQGSMTL